MTAAVDPCTGDFTIAEADELRAITRAIIAREVAAGHGDEITGSALVEIERNIAALEARDPRVRLQRERQASAEEDRPVARPNAAERHVELRAEPLDLVRPLADGREIEFQSVEADLERARWDTTNAGRIARHNAGGPRNRDYLCSMCSHDAAHAVAAEKNGIRVIDMYLEFAADGTITNCYTRFSRPPSAVVLAAGAAFAQVAGFSGRGADELSPGDVAALRKLGYRTPDQRTVVVAAATRCVRENWLAIAEVAAELAATGEVSGDRVREILLGVSPQ